MKGPTYHGPGRRTRGDAPDPTVSDTEDAVARVDAVTICGTDLHLTRSQPPGTTMKPNTDPETTLKPDPADVARRIAERRTQLGLSEEMLATQAGMAPRYLRHLTQAGVDFDPGGLLRIAAALHMTYGELLEGPSDPPPGQTGPAPRPVLIRLTTPECWEKLGTHGVGRVALPVRPGPAVLPVNYTVDAGTVVYRTDPKGIAAPGDGAAVSFQADRIDDHLRNGWSVLIVGTARHVDDPDTVARLAQLPGTEPWAGGNRPLWVRIEPAQITGRSVGTM